MANVIPVTPGRAARVAWKFVRCCAVVLIACSNPAANGQETANELERRVKAAFLYKFAGYVEWPAGSFERADSPVTIGVAGDDPLAAEVAQLVAGRSVDERPLSVRRVTSPELASGVHILFIGREEKARITQFVRALPLRPMLIVTESDGALDQGSMINFMIVEGRVRFEISLAAAERRGIKLSSRLLTVAQNVRPGAAR